MPELSHRASFRRMNPFTRRRGNVYGVFDDNCSHSDTTSKHVTSTLNSNAPSHFDDCDVTPLIATQRAGTSSIKPLICKFKSLPTLLWKEASFVRKQEDKIVEKKSRVKLRNMASSEDNMIGCPQGKEDTMIEKSKLTTPPPKISTTPVTVSGGTPRPAYVSQGEGEKIASPLSLKNATKCPVGSPPQKSSPAQTPIRSAATRLTLDNLRENLFGSGKKRDDNQEAAKERGPTGKKPPFAEQASIAEKIEVTSINKHSIDHAQPISYWCGRFSALIDRYRTEDAEDDCPSHHTSEAETERQLRALTYLYNQCTTAEARQSLIFFQRRLADELKNSSLQTRLDASNEKRYVARWMGKLHGP
ncbi:hypothetical protein K470DRAFT_264901 [Piedraia hortae CBS 480.64]|uniref:Uncharacterized protein n=1 Tax=Piedraia hortae CBS 480.64 TaxID=1314780 RepID=A0A6A7BZH7_9PEZI|nr:hypothetical protein K470DRAFT_264901 [Piedraia hortae CBS 480.64]